MRRLYFIILFLVALFSCDDSVKEFNVRYLSESLGSFSNSDIVSDIEFVPLQETDSSMVGNIVALREYDGDWYLLDNQFGSKLYKFTENGKFCSKYSREGRGPEEYGEIYSFDINTKNGDVILLCGPPKLLILTKDLNFKELILLETFYSRVACHDDDVVLYDPMEANVDYFDLDKKRLATIVDLDQDKTSVLSPMSIFMRDGERLFFHTEESKAVYEIKNGNANPILYIDYPNRDIICEFYREHSFQDISFTESLKYIRPKVHSVICNNDTSFSLIYSDILYRMNFLNDGKIVDGPLKMFCANPNVIISDECIIGHMPQYSYSDDVFIKGDLYKGVNVKLLSPEYYDVESGNPILIKYKLK